MTQPDSSCSTVSSTVWKPFAHTEADSCLQLCVYCLETAALRNRQEVDVEVKASLASKQEGLGSAARTSGCGSLMQLKPKRADWQRIHRWQDVEVEEVAGRRRGGGRAARICERMQRRNGGRWLAVASPAGSRKTAPKMSQYATNAEKTSNQMTNK